MSAGGSLITLGSGSSPIIWPPPPRAPLPAFPSIVAQQPPPPYAGCWASAQYGVALPFTPPPVPTVSFFRGNFCGVRVPGYAGGDGPDPSLMITWQLTNNAPDEAQKAIAYYTGVCGYTHLVLSIPQVKNQGKTLDDLIRVAAYAKAAGLFVCVVAVSDGDPFSVAVPWLDALRAQGLLDIVCFCWQTNFYYSPSALIPELDAGAAYSHDHALLFVVQWANEADAWWDDETCTQYGICDRFAFQAYFTDKIDVHLHQCNTEAPIDEVQSGLAKILQSLTTQKLCMCENTAQAQYDTPYERLEKYGDLKGRLSLVASWHDKVMDGGYFNGGRREDGSVL